MMINVSQALNSVHTSFFDQVSVQSVVVFQDLFVAFRQT